MDYGSAQKEAIKSSMLIDVLSVDSPTSDSVRTELEVAKPNGDQSANGTLSEPTTEYMTSEVIKSLKRHASLDSSPDVPSTKRRRTSQASLTTEDKHSTVNNTGSGDEIDSSHTVAKKAEDINQEDQFKILEQNEIFVEKDDDFEFSHTKITLQRQDQYFYATIKDRMKAEDEIDLSKLEVHPISRAHIYPILPSQASMPLPDDLFIKRPSLISYGDSKNLTEISSLFMHEAQMCERIKRSPHPNIVQYFGCLLDEDGFMSGLCFRRFNKTLYQMVEAREEIDQELCLSSIKAGIEHLHSLGIIHCDINPHNVFTDTSTSAIGDFDSCTLEGDELGAKAGTDDWTNEDFEFAQRENDWYGFEKIREFLSSRNKKHKPTTS